MFIKFVDYLMIFELEYQAHEVAKDARMVFVEDIDFRVWAKGMFGKHTLDAGFGQFVSILSWVCWKQGIYFEKVNKDYTSQVCPNCDTHTGKKGLVTRVHNCDDRWEAFPS